MTLLLTEKSHGCNTKNSHPTECHASLVGQNKKDIIDSKTIHCGCGFSLHFSTASVSHYLPLAINESQSPEAV